MWEDPSDRTLMVTQLQRGPIRNVITRLRTKSGEIKTTPTRQTNSSSTASYAFWPYQKTCRNMSRASATETFPSAIGNVRVQFPPSIYSN
jgi:hypothetical protein